MTPSFLPSRRADTPLVRQYARGNADKARAIAMDPSATARCVDAFTEQFYATTSKQSRGARALRWEEIAGADGSDPYELTPELIIRTVAILWASDYRSAAAIADQARATFLARDGVWTGALEEAFRNAKRGVDRGLGPARHTAAFPLARAKELPDSRDPRVKGGPVWPRRVDVTSCSWMLREIEAGGVTVGDVTIGERGLVTIVLPASKTDCAALGVSRSHRCACGTRSGEPALLDHALCPACAVIEQRDDVVSWLGPGPNTPLFPDSSGGFTSKAAMIGSIEAAAELLGLPLRGHTGAALWGGHAWRRGGAQYFAAAGVEVWRIQALARHSTSAILGYIEGMHVKAMSNLAAEAAIGRSLAAVRTELEQLQASVSREKLSLDCLDEPSASSAALVPLALEDVLPDSPDPAACSEGSGPAAAPDGAKWSYVTSTRKGGKVHTISLAGGRKSLCGWSYAYTTFFAVSPSPLGPDPATCAPRCPVCVRREDKPDVVALDVSDSPSD